MIRFAVTFVAVVIADYLIDGVSLDGPATTAVFAGVLAVLNAVVRPIVMLITCPIQLITLGLATLAINAVFFMLAGGITNLLDAGAVATGGFLQAFLAALIVSVVSTVVSMVARR